MPLLTPARALRYLPSLTAEADERVTEAIADAEGLIARRLGWVAPSAGADLTLALATYTLYAGGDGDDVAISPDGQQLRLPVWPIVSVTSIHEDLAEEYAAASLVPSTDYRIAPDGRAVVLKSTATRGAWLRSPRAVRIVCRAGWQDAPRDVGYAIALTTQHLLSQGAGIQTTVESSGVRVSNQRRSIPVEALEAIAPLLPLRVQVA